MMDNSKAVKSQLLKKEDEIVRAAMLYCADHCMEFNGKHKIMAKVMLRKFFETGVVPLMRDIYEDNVKKYVD